MDPTGNLLLPILGLRSSSAGLHNHRQQRTRNLISTPAVQLQPFNPIHRSPDSHPVAAAGLIWPLPCADRTRERLSQVAPRHACREHTIHAHGQRPGDRSARHLGAREPTLANIPERFADARVYAGSTQNYVKEIFSVWAGQVQWTHPFATHWGPSYADRLGGYVWPGLCNRHRCPMPSSPGASLIQTSS